MIDESSLEKVLRNCPAPPVPAGLRGRLLADIRLPVSPARRPTRRVWLRHPVLLACVSACLLFACVLVVSLAFKPASVHAATLEALESAASFHVNARLAGNGDDHLEIEIWHDASLGTYMRQQRGGWDQITLEKGGTTWIFSPGGKLISRSPGSGSFRDGMHALFSLLPGSGIRDSTGDMTVNGVQCFKFTSSLYGGVEYWVDSRNRLHRLLQKHNTRPGEALLTEVDYTARPNPALFSTDFEPGARIVDPRVELDRMFPTDMALLRHDLAGLSCALHRIVPLERGMVMILASSRLNDALRADLPPIAPLDSVGEARLESRIAAEDGGIIPSGYTCHRLADLKQADLNLTWYVLIPPQLLDGASPKGSLMLRASALGQLGQLRINQGEPRAVELEIEIPFALASPPSTLEAELGAIENLCSEYLPIVHVAQWMLPDPQRGQPLRMKDPAALRLVATQVGRWEQQTRPK